MVENDKQVEQDEQSIVDGATPKTNWPKDDENPTKPKTKLDLLNDPNSIASDFIPFIKITDEMKNHFLECSLSGKPYMQKFTIIDEKVEVIFRTMRVEELEQISETFSKFDEKTSVYQISQDVLTQNLRCMLYSVIINGRAIDWENKSSRDKYIKNIPQFIYDRLIKLNHIFLMYIEQLKKEVFSADF
jgi:hypothetical protein